MASTALFRIALLASCWWAITEGDGSAVAIGVLAVALALALSLQMHPPQRISLVGLLRFVPTFLWRSLSGGIDVARRALTPMMPIEPKLIEFRTRLPPGPPRVVFANVVSLVPGTLCADLRDDVMVLHTLTQSAADEHDLRKLEQTIASLFP